MSDATATGSGEGASTGRVGAWTDAERVSRCLCTQARFASSTNITQVQFLLRVLKSAYSDGKGPDWKTINMPGRTTKALQHQWASVTAQMRDLDAGGDGAAPAKPRSSTIHFNYTHSLLTYLAAPKKRAGKKTAAKNEDGEEGDEPNDGDGDDGTPKKPATPRKRGPAITSGRFISTICLKSTY